MSACDVTRGEGWRQTQAKHEANTEASPVHAFGGLLVDALVAPLVAYGVNASLLPRCCLVASCKLLDSFRKTPIQPSFNQKNTDLIASG